MEYDENTGSSTLQTENETIKETLYFYNLQLFVINSELMALGY